MIVRTVIVLLASCSLAGAALAFCRKHDNKVREFNAWIQNHRMKAAGYVISAALLLVLYSLFAVPTALDGDGVLMSKRWDMWGMKSFCVLFIST